MAARGARAAAGDCTELRTGKAIPDVSENLLATGAGGPNTYATRPPWAVPGVDYGVGPHFGTGTRDPLNAGATDSVAALSALGVGFNSGNWNLDFNKPNVTINGYDFGLHNGFTCQVNASNVTFINCKFKGGSNLRCPIIVAPSAVGFTMRYCECDGNKVDWNSNGGQPGGIAQINAAGDVTIEFCYWHSAWYQGIDWGACYTGGTTTSANFRYNVMRNTGYAAVNGGHGDWIQYVGSTYTTPMGNVDNRFNLYLQDEDTLTASTQGLSTFSSAGNTVFATRVTESFNVAISCWPVSIARTGGPRNINYPFLIDLAKCVTWSCENNYCDPTGYNYGWCAQYNSGATIVGGLGKQGRGNINLLNGQDINLWTNYANLN